MHAVFQVLSILYNSHTLDIFSFNQQFSVLRFDRGSIHLSIYQCRQTYVKRPK